MVALSDSSVTSDCSFFTTSPGLTSTSITATSLKSPMSGTLISIALLMFKPLERDQGGASCDVACAGRARSLPGRLAPHA